MNSSRRHESLIPLSREHQYALLLCLRIHRRLETNREDSTWLRQKAGDVIQFFDEDLTPHFKAEEEILFPPMMRFTGASILISDLTDEHRKIEGLVKQLRQATPNLLGGLLERFADLLEAHIRKEERILFPLYEQQASPAITHQVGREIANAIGNALHPRHPELF